MTPIGPYVDPIAVERAVAGHPVRLYPLERRAVCQILTAKGLSSRKIARQVGISARTVVRARSRATVEVSALG